MRLLLTRPELDAESSREKLIALGHKVTVAPLITIRLLEDVRLPQLQWQAVLVTSGNGARALGHHPDAAGLRTLPVFAVGDQSATRLREQGFTNVLSADGNAEALAKLAREHLNPAHGPVLHVAGSVRAGDLGRLLGDAFEFHRAVLYEATPVAELPSAISSGLRNGQFDGILFYSPRTARIFSEFILGSSLMSSLSLCIAYCLSPAVARALPENAFKTLKIAADPKEAALLVLIEAD